VIFNISVQWERDEFSLQGTFMAEVPAKDVFLFLFSPDVQDSGSQFSVYLPPENKAYYWSFDPKGTTQLSAEDAEQIGLPHVNFQATVFGSTWSRDIYDLIGHFHLAKGYNPHSQDVAIELGYPLLDVQWLDDILDGEDQDEEYFSAKEDQEET
jgi:hypothetical protein